ncbi:MAG TPA: hypothetical protein VNH46_00645 [Gemmatimonadales bacterium]|nr:hypothetical protein [Gemmatimonadales bacterium]
MRHSLGIALLLMAGAACGGDGGTAPPVNVDLTGAWSVTMSPIQGHGIVCQISGLQVQLVHSGNDLGGTYSVADMECNGEHTGPGTGQVVSGTVINGQLHFHFDTEDFDLHGSIRSADTAAGTYTISVNVSGTVYTFTGSWTARRL